MISCEQAVQSINLHYAMIKFLEFRGVMWHGLGLPLRLHSLGDLVTCQVEVIEAGNGPIQRGVVLDRGMLMADFLPNRRSTIKMRLEYRAPFAATPFACDFESIHPQHYEANLDFSLGQVARAGDLMRVQLAREYLDLPLGTSGDWTFDRGVEVAMKTTGESIWIRAAHGSPVPFSHEAFPLMSFLPSS